MLPPFDAGSLRFGERVAAAGPWLAIAAPTAGDDAGAPGEVVVGRLLGARPASPGDRTEPPALPAGNVMRRGSEDHDGCVTFAPQVRLRSHASFDHFGSALGLGLVRTALGPEPLLLVGRDQAETNGLAAGAVDVYRPAPRGRGGESASRDWVLEATLDAALPELGAEFGASLSLATGDPSIAVVGAPRADVLGHFDAGRIEVFRRDVLVKPPVAFPPRTSRTHGAATEARREGGDSDASAKDRAHASSEARWRRVASIRCAEPQASAWFGRVVATDGRWIAVGAPGTDVEVDGVVVQSAGSVHLYRIDPDAIVSVASIVAPTASRSMWFGSALAIDDGRLLVGAPGAEIVDNTGSTRNTVAIGDDAPTDEGVRCGLAFLYEISSLADGFDGQPVALEPPVVEAGAGFGQSVALVSGWALVGAPGLDGVVTQPDGTETAIEDAGRALLFELPWRGAAHTEDALSPSRVLGGPSRLPMALFATDAAFAELHAGGPLVAVHGHLYVEEESHGPSPGVAIHRVH